MDDTLYDRVGGEDWFVALVDRFYVLVEDDPRLRPLYPEDLSEPRRNLANFLAQYWGGPQAYSLERGHPRLRMRHAPFPIGRPERDRWFEHMTAAVRGGGLNHADEQELLVYFDMAATAMINLTS